MLLVIFRSLFCYACFIYSQIIKYGDSLGLIKRVESTQDNLIFDTSKKIPKI